MNQLNNFTEDEKENKLNLRNCKYGDPDYFNRKAFSFFHMNICSRTKMLMILTNYSVNQMLVLALLQLQN